MAGTPRAASARTDHSAVAARLHSGEAPPENILLIRLKSMGDILFTLPAAHALRAAFSKARMTFLVSQEYAPLLAGFPDVDSVIALDRARFRSRNPRIILAETQALLRRLRQGKFSLAVDFQGYGETAFMTWYTGAPQRWGAVKHLSRRLAYTHGARQDPKAHPVENNLALLQHCGVATTPSRNQFLVPANGLEGARQFYAERGLKPDCATFFIQPFTSSTDKEWPLDCYLATGQHWRNRGFQVIFGGGPADIAKLEPAVQAGFPVAAGVPLLVTAGLMKHAVLVLGGDTGLVHLAVALGKRAIMIIGSTKPGTSYPFGHRDWAVLPPVRYQVRTVTCEAIQAACARALRELGIVSSCAAQVLPRFDPINA